MDPINPINDSRISHCNANLNGINYHYLLGIPPGGYKATIFLVHGWPDLSMGWRYQIPPLLKLGYRVVCPDIMGFGRTEAPNLLEYYTFKRAASDIKELAHQLNCPQIILGGHDWGGAIAYRTALHHPTLITHLFSICTPYSPPTTTFTPLETLVETKVPHWGYQLHLASGRVEREIRSREQIWRFLNAAFGGEGTGGETGFTVEQGPLYEGLGLLGRTKLVGGGVLEWYAAEFERNGIGGTLNWYRTRELNFRDELELDKKTIDIPVLFIQATKDAALPPGMSDGFERFIPNLTKRSVETSHWALWEAPEQVNGIIKDWLEKVGQLRSNL